MRYYLIGTNKKTMSIIDAIKGMFGGKKSDDAGVPIELQEAPVSPTFEPEAPVAPAEEPKEEIAPEAPIEEPVAPVEEPIIAPVIEEPKVEEPIAVPEAPAAVEPSTPEVPAEPVASASGEGHKIGE